MTFLSTTVAVMPDVSYNYTNDNNNCKKGTCIVNFLAEVQ